MIFISRPIFFIMVKILTFSYKKSQLVLKHLFAFKRSFETNFYFMGVFLA